jgi:PH (Pleckstrin Homology) domain-containing protein
MAAVSKPARWLLGLLRVPPEPHLPAGEPGSARVFRAAPNYWRLKLLGWSLRQAFTVAGFVFFMAFLEVMPEKVELSDKGRRRSVPLATLASYARGLEVFGIALWLVQLPITFAIIRLDYQLRWYVVTDRAARLREGVLTLTEMTFTLLNVQDIRIHQGPLQRLLGLADVELRTAGGSDASPAAAGHGSTPSRNLHLARFRGVDNAPMIRDLVLQRMKRARDAGLGDPDDAASETDATGPSALERAARELLAESAALRVAVSRAV